MAFGAGRSHESRQGGGQRQRRDRPRYAARRRVCAFCADKSKVIDFRDGAKLRRYLSDRGKIDSRRKTATCSKHQREMATAIKRARHLALLPFTIAHVRLMGPVGLRAPFGRFAPAPPPPVEKPHQEQAPTAPAAAAAVEPSPGATAAPAPSGEAVETLPGERTDQAA